MKRSFPLVPAGCEHYRSQVEMPPELNDRLRRCAHEFGETYAAYLVTEQGGEVLSAKALDLYVVT